MWYRSINFKKKTTIDSISLSDFFIERKINPEKIPISNLARWQEDGIFAIGSIGIKKIITPQKTYKNIIIYTNDRYYFDDDFDFTISGKSNKTKEFREIRKLIDPFVVWCNLNMRHLKNHYLILKNQMIMEVAQDLKRQATARYTEIYREHKLTLAQIREIDKNCKSKIASLEKKSLSKKNQKLNYFGISRIGANLNIYRGRYIREEDHLNRIFSAIKEFVGENFTMDDFNELLADRIEEATKGLVNHDHQEKVTLITKEVIIRYCLEKDYFNND